MVLKLTYYGTFDSECTFITKYKKKQENIILKKYQKCFQK
jgi:hypothetical protein